MKKHHRDGGHGFRGEISHYDETIKHEGKKVYKGAQKAMVCHACGSMPKGENLACHECVRHKYTYM